MKNKLIDSTLVDKAIIFATNAHKNVERKGKGFPYIVHPLEVMAIVATMTNDQDLLAAAVLHDTVEDTSITVEDIRKEFNDRVADIVRDESDRLSPEDNSLSWKERKIKALEVLRNAPKESKMVALGDKLSNMRAIYRDYLMQGEALWDIFSEKRKSEHAWRYNELLDCFKELKNTQAYAEFSWLVKMVFPKEK